MNHFSVMWQTLYFNICRVQRCNVNVHGRPIAFQASTVSALMLWITNNGDTGGRYSPVNISYFSHKTDQPLERGLTVSHGDIRAERVMSRLMFLYGRVSPLGYGCYRRVTGPVTEILSDLKGGRCSRPRPASAQQ